MKFQAVRWLSGKARCVPNAHPCCCRCCAAAETGERVAVVRPLLSWRKRELEAHCQRSGLAYVVDPTNARLSYHRNLIRHLLLTVPPPQQHKQQQQQQTQEMQLLAKVEQRPEQQQDAQQQLSAALSPPTPIVDAILMLQRRCEAVGAMLEERARGLLERSVLHSSVPGLPALRRLRRHAVGARDPLQWERQQPWFVDWDVQMEETAAALRPLPFAMLRASSFRGEGAAGAAGGAHPGGGGGGDEAVVLAALSHVLQAVSGQCWLLKCFPILLDCSPVVRPLPPHASTYPTSLATAPLCRSAISCKAGAHPAPAPGAAAGAAAGRDHRRRLPGTAAAAQQGALPALHCPERPGGGGGSDQNTYSLHWRGPGVMNAVKE